MGRTDKYLAMATDMSDSELIGSDLNDLGSAARKLMNHAFHLGGGLGLGFGTILLQALASVSGMYVFPLIISNSIFQVR